MLRKITSVIAIVVLLAPLSAAADTGQSSGASKPSSPHPSTTRRVVWTVIGAGAGFAAGAFLGLNKFDDSINSDRKVWTSAIVGAAAGGVAGALLSRNIGRAPRTTTVPRPADDSLGITWESAVKKVPLR